MKCLSAVCVLNAVCRGQSVSRYALFTVAVLVSFPSLLRPGITYEVDWALKIMTLCPSPIGDAT